MVSMQGIKGLEIYPMTQSLHNCKWFEVIRKLVIKKIWKEINFNNFVICLDNIPSIKFKLLRKRFDRMYQRPTIQIIVLFI